MGVTQAVTVVFKVFLCYIWALWRLVFSGQEKKIAGKLVLVTGGGQGIGRALAWEFAERGANIALWDINQETCTQTAEDISVATGVKVIGYVCDVTDYKKVKAVAAQVRQDLGDVDILVNNAGIAHAGPIVERPESRIRKMFDVNVLSHFWTVKEFLPSMVVKSEGHIVGVASLAAFVPSSLATDYCATKRAVHGFCDSLREELHTHYGTKDVLVSVVCPALVKTQLSDDLAKEVIIKKSEEDELLPEQLAKEVVARVLKNEKLISVPSAGIALRFLQAVMPQPAWEIIQHSLFDNFEADKSLKET